VGSQRPRHQRREASAGGAPDGLRRSAPARSVISLHGRIGNRAVGRLLRAPPKATKGTAASGTPGTADEITAAEAWVTYVSLRGNSAAPKVPVPARYRGLIEALKSGVAGNPGEPDHLDIAGSAALLKRLRADHDRVIPKADHHAFELAQLALERALVDVGKGPDAFEGGATQQDYGINLAHIWTEAGEELGAAQAAGYTIPDRLKTAVEEARAMYDTAAADWTAHAPDQHKLITPGDELSLVEFRRETVEVINSMRAKRAADEARARRAEAEALQQAADRQLAQMRALMAEKRRELFRAGATSKLKQLHEASGELVRAIGDVKDAAGIITKRVDQLNTVGEYVKGAKLINLPELPEGLTAVTKKLTAFHSKLTTVIELLDLAGPGKTQLDEGIKYLQGVDLAIEHFASKSANPFIAVYVNAYLGPGIKNCMKLLGDIAAIYGRQNRSAIEQDQAWGVNWAVEPGGEPLYAYVRLVFKQGAGAPLGDAAYSYLDDHEDDFSAAVDDAMPGSRASIGDWASRNRYALWETLYGSIRPPR